MSKTISFKHLVKMIHPDTNPHIEDPGDKMQEATRYLDNEEALYRLAVKWGLIEDDISQTDIKYRINEGKHLQKDGESCIVLDSYWENSKLTVILYNKTKGGKYEKHQRTDEWDQDDNFYVDGIYMEDDYIHIDYNYQLLVSRRGKL